MIHNMIVNSKEILIYHDIFHVDAFKVAKKSIIFFTRLWFFFLKTKMIRTFVYSVHWVELQIRITQSSSDERKINRTNYLNGINYLDSLG